MSHTWCAIPEDAVVFVAMGDLQCSIFSKLHMSPDSAGYSLCFFQLNIQT